MNLSEEWCEFSDLPKSQCAHCKGVDLDGEIAKVANSDDPRPLLGKVVAAKFQGTCPECGDPIDIGDMIAKAEGDPEGPWIHYGCGR